MREDEQGLEAMLKAIALDWGHTIMDERRDQGVPLRERPAHVMPGVREVLPTLTLPLAIWANTREAREADVRDWLRRAAIEHFFQSVTTSVDAGARKPASAFFEYALAQFGFASSEVLFVGNQLNTDVRGGVKYGIATVWLSSPSHRSDNDEQTEDAAPTYTISTLHELPALVARLLR